MPHIIPFRAIRPERSKAALTATRSYITYTDEEREDKLKNNPYSFMRIIHPPGSEKLSGEEKFLKVREAFLNYLQEGDLIKEDQPAFYIYEQSYGNHIFKGIIAGISVDDYNNGKIKKHEHTLTNREKMFKEYLQTTQLNAEPVLLTYSRQKEIDDCIARYEQTRPEYEFTTTDHHTHKLWIVQKREDIDLLQNAFRKLDSVYIADGHHRSASSALLGNEKRGGAQSGSDQKLPTDYFSAYLISDHNLEIKPFYRGVKFKKTLSPDAFLKQIKKSFDVECKNETPVEPVETHKTGLYIEGLWYEISPKKGTYDENNPVEILDCHILSTRIFRDILGVKDEKTDANIQFIPAVNGVQSMVDCVNRGEYKAGFVPPPVKVDQLKKVADHNLIMPPKSTWVEPKLRSGLVIYDINEF